MALQGWLKGGVGAMLVLAALLWPSAQGALANSGSMSVVDAGKGLMSVKAEATLTDCGPGLCAWFAAIRERHSSLPCADDYVFKVGILGFQAQAGTVQATRTYKPFFPRSAKLCLYAKSPFGSSDLLAEATYRVPSGYGSLRSSSRRCVDFSSQAAAQYYLYLYPDDPSGLDPDRNGEACEGNPCPCGAEPIAAEPAEPSRKLCLKAQAGQRRARLALKVAQRRLRKAADPAASRRWSHKLKTRKAALRKAKRRVRKVCRKR